MDAMTKFLASYPSRKYAKGTIILHQDDEPPCIYAVKEGIVRIYDISAAGDEQPIIFDQATEMFPIGYLFELIDKAQYFYEAHTNVVVYCVPRQDIITFLKKNPGALYETFKSFAERYLGFQMRLLSLEQPKAADKVLQSINFLSGRFGRRLDDARTHIRLPFTQQDLANFIGLTRETTGIELKKLEKQGIIVRYKQRYIVYVKKLRSKLGLK